MTSDASHLSSKLSLSPGISVERFGTRVRVNWQAALHLEGKDLSVRVWDISIDGLSFVTDAALALGARLAMTLLIRTPDESAQRIAVPLSIQICNNILTREGFRAGAYIEAIDAEHKQLLTKWIERLQPSGE